MVPPFGEAPTGPTTRHSPSSGRFPHQLENGKWEMGSDLHTAMVKSSVNLIRKLDGTADYTKLKAWLSSVEDWVNSHMHVMPE